MAYNSVLKAFAKVSPAQPPGQLSAAAQAEALLNEMKEQHTKQHVANQNWYAALSNGELTDQEVTRGPPLVWVKPNVRSYSTVMDAYARIGTREAAEKVDTLLEELLTAFQESSDESLRPTLITYNTVLAAWSRVAGATDRCIRVLEDMPMPPDIISYNACLNSIARSGSPTAGARAEALLRSIDSQSRGDKAVQPNARTYTTCINAWGQSGDPDKALALLNEMKSLWQRTRDARLKPNIVSYASCMNAYARSKDPDKATKAFALFQDMRKNGVRPNIVTYNNVINCCATSTTRPELIELVEDLYHQVLASRRADQFTFGTVLKASSNLLGKEKSQFAETVFRQACAHGQVSDGVLWQFRQAVPMETYREMVGGSDHVRHADLPSEWSKNLKR